MGPQLSPSTVHHLHMGVAFGLTDVGAVRETNQDNFCIAPELGLVVVADGMGGHDAGEIASADAITLVYAFLQAALDAQATQPPAADTDTTMRAMVTLHEAVAFANERMYRTNCANHQADGAGMGTTLTGMWQAAPHGPLFIFHVGDSRLYCFRHGRLNQLTRDQTLYQQALEAGMKEPLPARNLLLQALGPARGVKPDVHTHIMAPGDVYLLCSDGLYGNSTPETIAGILARANPDNLPQCCAELLAMAERDGSRDNITAVLLRCNG